MVARSATLREPRPGPKNSTILSTTPKLPERLRHGENEIRRRHTLAEACRVSRMPTTSGISMYRGWPRSAASASMPPTPQPSTPMPLIMGVCESVPTSVSGKATRALAPVLDLHHLCEVLEVHLVHDARRGWHDAEVREGLGAPAKELVALPVALELQRRVAGKRACRRRTVHLDGMVDHEVHGDHGVDPLRVTAEGRHGVAHGGEVHDGRNPGEILHDHARRLERELAAPGLRRIPGAQGCTSSSRTSKPFTCRSTDSSRTLIENGMRDTLSQSLRLQA